MAGLRRLAASNIVASDEAMMRTSVSLRKMIATIAATAVNTNPVERSEGGSTAAWAKDSWKFLLI
ncbi:hypothetical protein MnTg02_02803 [bacterium MnTg02]|nr:hypothetical protein MnTg02_02803 [bacterium MnTg02]